MFPLKGVFNSARIPWGTIIIASGRYVEPELEGSVRLQVVAGPRFELATEDVAVQVSALKMFGSLPKLGRSHWPHDAILLETAVIPGPPPVYPPVKAPSTLRSDPAFQPL